MCVEIVFVVLILALLSAEEISRATINLPSGGKKSGKWGDDED